MAKDASIKQPKQTTQVMKCRFHSDLDIEMYCGTHDMVYCCLCIAKDHSSCFGVKEIKDVKHKFDMSTLQSLVADVNRASDKLRGIKSGKSDKLQLIERQEFVIKREIEALIKQFDTCLDKLKQNIIAKLYEEQDELKTELYANITDLDEQINVTAKYKPDLASQYDEKQIFIAEKLGRAVLEDADDLLCNQNMSKLPTLKFKPNNIVCEAIEKANYLGEITRRDKQTQGSEGLNVVGTCIRKILSKL